VLATILSSFRVADIRKKLLFTAALLALYRLGSYIPVPGVSTEALKQLEENYAGSNILGFLNLFTGGGLSRIALFALGIMPYITASIILQLLTVVSPSLEKLQKEGEVGQARITQYTRYRPSGSPPRRPSATSSSSARRARAPGRRCSRASMRAR
jgi:preprotein translocase subunit SecY